MLLIYLSAQLFPGQFASAVRVFLKPSSFAKEHTFVWTVLELGTLHKWRLVIPWQVMTAEQSMEPPVTGQQTVHLLWNVDVASKILLLASA